jgi:hypothetical protein
MLRGLQPLKSSSLKLGGSSLALELCQGVVGLVSDKGIRGGALQGAQLIGDTPV